MRDTKTTLYDDEGIQHTETTLECVRSRVESLGLRHVVVATTTGKTALDCVRLMPPDVKVIGVMMHAVDHVVYVQRHGQKIPTKDPDIMAEACRLGVQFYTGVHPFRGAVSSAISSLNGGCSGPELLADLLMHVFSTGTKVAVECSLMAADAGYLDMDADVIAVGGYRGGADTALVLKPAFSYRFFEMKVREMICFPSHVEADTSSSREQ